MRLGKMIRELIVEAGSTAPTPSTCSVPNSARALEQNLGLQQGGLTASLRVVKLPRATISESWTPNTPPFSVWQQGTPASARRVQGRASPKSLRSGCYPRKKKMCGRAVCI